MERSFDEVPESTDQEVTIYVLIQTHRETIHSIAYYQIVSVVFGKEKPFDLGDIKARFRDDLKFELMGLFTSMERAVAFQNRCVLKSRRDYSLILRELPDLQLVQDRPFFAHIGEEVTRAPGVYKIKKNDYDKLKTRFPTVRLPTPEEIDAELEPTSSFIPNDYSILKSLNLEELKSIRTSPEIEPSYYLSLCRDFDRLSFTLENLKLCCCLLMKGSPYVKREHALEHASKLFPDNGGEVVDQLIEFLRNPETRGQFEFPTTKFLAPEGASDCREMELEFC